MLTREQSAENLLEAHRAEGAKRCPHCKAGRYIAVEAPEAERGWIYHSADKDWTDTDCAAEEMYRAVLVNQMEAAVRAAEPKHCERCGTNYAQARCPKCDRAN
jgi:predicted Zn-ribbon and HTH transcriptional regulator